MKHSVFDNEYRDIWAIVYGVPLLIGLLAIIFGGISRMEVGLFLIVSVLGSYVTISAIEAFHNWLEK